VGPGIPNTGELFRRLDRKLLDRCIQPREAARRSSRKAAGAAKEDGVPRPQGSASNTSLRECGSNFWFAATAPRTRRRRCSSPTSPPDFGIHESLPIDSAVLAILPRSPEVRSELGVPLNRRVGPSLLIARAIPAVLAADGWLRRPTPELDFYNLSIDNAATTTHHGSAVRVRVISRSHAVFCNGLEVLRRPGCRLSACHEPPGKLPRRSRHPLAP